MFPLITHFEELLKNIQPPQERLEAARDLPPLVRDYIAESKEFPTVSPDSRLAGSYAQQMAVGDVKDVDTLIRIPGNPKANEPKAKQLIQDMKKLLDSLPEALGYEGYAEAEIEVERARRSVHVYFKDKDFHLDFVPCIAPDGFENVLYVPDRGFNKWIASHPIGYIKLLNDLQKQYDNKVKPLGKLLKHFRDYQMKTRKPKSYWLGALLVYHIQEGNLDMTQPLAVPFYTLLNEIYCQYDHLLSTSSDATPNILDPMLDHNISWNWSRTYFETFMRRINEGRNWAAKALETDDREKAIEYWQKIFGEEYFPSDVETTVSRLATKGLPGKSYVSSTGLIVSSQPASGIYTSTIATKFHGTEQS
ncbi:nucleotidyltransferase (plasmid) [Brasilonema octagenarum UFV-E1]|uniref:Nucleotidyltransferase n=2 Tax=Brasilonema TaxID=383614 RepID=A0A856MMB8_9CYAN|nr:MULTISPECIES: nucleotidyltransferase [Brasilonema]NMF65740.1 nucleotidyltransferase [Brasilonema octagenarum UFV-OR1]QDL12583.1 nucleotidyltransferase [Brasilonema sennae CENA114]QDL18977.1 nucleotidyltransferase [Brasilonema octagenarum UFV-E1]